MKCMNCSTEIPPNWVACIQKNICPACGESILDSSGEELLKELTEAMERMPNDPAGVAGWLLSNFFIKKIGSAEPVDEFYGRNNRSKSNSESNSRLEAIWKNSGVTPKTKASLKSKIENDVENILKNQYSSDDEGDSSEVDDSQETNEEELLDISSDEGGGSDLFSDVNKDLFSLSESDPRLSKLLNQDKQKSNFSGLFSRK